MAANCPADRVDNTDWFCRWHLYVFRILIFVVLGSIYTLLRFQEENMKIMIGPIVLAVVQLTSLWKGPLHADGLVFLGVQIGALLICLCFENIKIRNVSYTTLIKRRTPRRVRASRR